MSTSQIYGSIIYSPAWGDADHIRITWVTMLAMADYRGFVDAGIKGLAHVARLTEEECRSAVEFLEMETRDYPQARIRRTDRGWQIVNPSTYRSYRTPRQDQNAQAQARFRQKARLQALQPPKGV